MKTEAPFQHGDLCELGSLFERADHVVAMEDIADGTHAGAGVIGVRHDVDDNPGAFQTAIRMARWEAERGYRSSYYLLHTADYWLEPGFADGVDEIAYLGHEVGLHLNSLAHALRVNGDPVAIMQDALEQLRTITDVHSVVAHGDQLCHRCRFVNDELWLESPRPEYGTPDRWLDYNGTRVQIAPVSRAAYGLEFDPNWLPRAMYLSDSGGRWSLPFSYVADRFRDLEGSLFMLIHPDWWGQALSQQQVAA